MPDVIIAPCNILGTRNLGGSLNDIGNLPLGPQTALVTQKFNDDDTATEIATVIIPDIVQRNQDYIEPTLYEEKRSLIGKDSNILPPAIFDQTAVGTYNKLNSDRATIEEYEWDQQSRYNLVSFPFTTAEPFIIPGAPITPDPSIDPDVV
jgi:hypothetical protein